MELDVTSLSKDAAPLVRALVEPFTLRATDLGLTAALVWGFGAAPDFRKGWDGIQVALVFSGDPPLSPEILTGAGQLPAGKRAAFAPPLILTLEEIRSSLDVYPVEFLAIRETGRVVGGALDLSETFPVSAKDLRAQAEREWRGILFHARAALLGSGGASRDLAEIAVTGADRLLDLARATAVALGGAAAAGVEPVLVALEEASGLDSAPLREVLELRRAPKPRLDGAAFARLLTWVEAVIRRVDAA
ncbi:MAG: hypothetical protein ABIK09_11680 [Pseudomonadota bacterium]